MSGVGDSKRKVVVFDIRAARSALEAMGIAKHELDYIVEISDFVASNLAKDLDALVAKRSAEGGCMHPQSISLAVAVLAEKFLRARIEGVGEKLLDPIACIEVVRKFSEVEVDEDEVEDEDEAETPRPVTVH